MVGSVSIVAVGDITVIEGDMDVGVSTTVGAAVGCGGKDGKTSRVRAIPIRITPIPTEKIRGYFPTEGILAAAISIPPPRRPIKRKIAPTTSRIPSLVCGMIPSDV
ncbi:MAG: hypothetical protein Fur0044_14550 [Anaerolineae bacterium]